MLGAIVLARYALDVRSFQPDEVVYTTQGRELAARFPSALWDTTLFHLGLERLNPLIGALTSSLFSAGTAIAVHKVINAIAFASVTIPVYLLGRGLGLGAWAALLAAALGVAVPWAPLATSVINEPVAYPAFAWAVYGAWRACVRPGARSDLLALALVALAPLARSNLVVMVVPLIVGVLVSELVWEGAGSSRDGARAALRRHAVLLVALVLGALVALLRGLSSVKGVYSVDVVPPLDRLLDKSGLFVSYVGEGLMVVPLAFGLAWILRHVASREDRARQTFAVVALAAVLGLLYSLNNNVLQERYTMYLAWIPLLLMVATVARRDVPWPLVGVCAAAIALLVGTADKVEEASGYATFANPGQTWWVRVVEGQGRLRLPGPLADDPGLVALVVLVVLATVGALLLRRGGSPARTAARALLAAQLVAGVTVTGWALEKFVDGAGAAAGPGFAARSWVDEALPAGAATRGFVVKPDEGYAPSLAEVNFYNERVNKGIVPVTALLDALRPGGRLETALPEYVLVSTDRFQPLGVAGTRLASSPYQPVELVRPEQPPRASWHVTGLTDGWLDAPRGSASIRTWTACLAMTVTSAPDQPSRVVLRGPGGTETTRALRSGEATELVTARPGRSTLSATGAGTLPPARHVSALLTGLRAVRCG